VVPTWVVVVMLAAGCGRLRFDPLADAAAADTLAANDAVDAAPPNQIWASTFPSGAEIYEIDPTTLMPGVGTAMCTNIGGPDMGEIAFDASGQLIGFGYSQITMYRVEPDFATCTAFPLTAGGVSIGSSIKGAELVGGVLLAASANGELYRVNTIDGTAELVVTLAAKPSGDLVWTGTDLLMTVSPTTGNDTLVRIDQTTGAVTTIGTTQYGSVFGMAWRNGVLYALTDSGQVAIIDPTTAATVRVFNATPHWGGAAVY